MAPARSAQRGAGSAQAKPSGTWWPWVRKYALPTLALAAPVYFGSKLVQSLGGGALWLPREWRLTVSIFGTLIGLAAFNFARFRWAHGGLPSQPKLNGSKSAKQSDHHARAQLRSLRLYALSAVALSGYVFLRYACVHNWEPRPEWLVVREISHGGADDLPSFIDLEEKKGDCTDDSIFTRVTSGLASIFARVGSVLARWIPALNEAHASDGVLAGPTTQTAGTTDKKPPGVWRGSFLVPVRFSATTRADLAAIKREKQRDPVLYCLDSNEEWLIDRIEHGDQFMMAFTTLLFFAAHMGVLIFACMGFGSSFSIPEELIREISHVA